MSGLYIKGLKMPSRCEECFFLRDVGDYVFVGCKLNIGFAKNRAYEHRHDHCPLIPVPDHGRLIEEDAAYDKIAEEAHEDAGNYVDMDVVGRGLEYTPTIIPADESDMDSFIRILKD